MGVRVFVPSPLRVLRSIHLTLYFRTHFKCLHFPRIGLAASLSFGAASELVRRSASSSESANAGSGSLMLTEANVTRLVSKLSQMRGAALKIGQFLSIQGVSGLSIIEERGSWSLRRSQRID